MMCRKLLIAESELSAKKKLLLHLKCIPARICVVIDFEVAAKQY
jgi:hypothetical protein